MKKLFFIMAICLCAGAMFAQSNSIFPQEGKVMEYSAAVKMPTGEQKMEIKQFIKSKDGDNLVITTQTGGKNIDIQYKIAGAKIIISFQEMMNSALAQMGKVEVTEVSGDLAYPLTLEPNKQYDDVSMKIKGTIQGMEMTLSISMENRRAEGKESITVPAGTFECIKVLEENVVQVMGQDQISEITTWYAPGIGMVKQYTNSMNGMVTNTMELVKISDK
ncbi:MAG: hypothetical protein RR555_03430 [Bacteroidales bacterium]